MADLYTVDKYGARVAAGSADAAFQINENDPDAKEFLKSLDTKPRKDSNAPVVTSSADAGAEAPVTFSNEGTAKEVTARTTTVKAKK